MSPSLNLNKKRLNVNVLASKALKDKELLGELLEGLISKKELIRENCFKVLMLISAEHPETIYPKWDYFQNLLNSENHYHKYIAIYLITNLIRIDTENKFEKMFDIYFGILEGEGTVAAAHAALNSGKIAKIKPKLQSKITAKLLTIDKIHRGKQKELVKGYVIEAFFEYFADAKDKMKIIKFVKTQLESNSPKTRKKAKDFLEKYDE
ncbi:hypothetical protein KKG05_11580 [bacterium]|nr:hypothetical protein [bacterium]MBU1938030.1 hypothetical protein [bacterium]